jgi:hypothetical protein
MMAATPPFATKDPAADEAVEEEALWGGVCGGGGRGSGRSSNGIRRRDGFH